MFYFFNRSRIYSKKYYNCGKQSDDVYSKTYVSRNMSWNNINLYRTDSSRNFLDDFIPVINNTTIIVEENRFEKIYINSTLITSKTFVFVMEKNYCFNRTRFYHKPVFKHPVIITFKIISQTGLIILFNLLL